MQISVTSDKPFKMPGGGTCSLPKGTYHFPDQKIIKAAVNANVATVVGEKKTDLNKETNK